MAFIKTVSPTLIKIMTASTVNPVVNPIMPLKVRRITARAAPPSTYPMILIG
jgi:hypothetical protein